MYHKVLCHKYRVTNPPELLRLIVLADKCLHDPSKSWTSCFMYYNQLFYFKTTTAFRICAR